MEKSVRYFEEINILRAIAILAVISIHVSVYFTQMNKINLLATLYMSIDVFSQVAVPLFIFISGFVLYNKYPNHGNIIKFYKKRMVSVIPPYFIFSLFYLGMTYFGSIVLAKPFNHDISDIIYCYITGGCFYHLWFFVLIIQLYLLYPAILLIYNHFNLKGRTLELLLAAFIIKVLYELYPIWDESLGRTIVFIQYLFYLLLGMIVRSRYDEFLLKVVLKNRLYYISVPLLCSTILGIFIFAQKYFNIEISIIQPVAAQYWYLLATMISPFYFVVITVLCLNISINIVSHRSLPFKLMNKIGHYSFGIYLVHAFILYVIVLVFSKFDFDWNDWLFYPLTCLFTLVLSYLSVELVQKFPYSQYIIGSTK